MALSQWCTLEDLYGQAPELVNDAQMGIVPPGANELYIERATTRVKHLIQGRYRLTQFGSVATDLPTSLRTFTAIQAATLIFQARQVGDAAEKRLTELQNELLFWTTQAAMGSLLANDDTLITAQPGVFLGEGDTGMDLVDELYATGARYGVVDSDLAGPNRDWTGDWA